MSKTIGNYTWSDTYGITAAKDGTNIGIRCYTYLTATQGYGSCYAFFNISYTPLYNQKLRVSINSVQLRQDEWTSRDWVLSGSIKVNGYTLFNGSITTPSGQGYTYNTNITAGGSYYVDIDFPNFHSTGDLALNYEFSLYFKTDIYVNSWKGWTNSSEETCTASYTYYHYHSWSSTVTSPTCTAQGYTTYTCSSCGYSYNAYYTSALGHSYADATCTKPQTCTRCGATTGSALGHSWNSGVVTTEPTYTADGVMTYTCTRTGCGTTKTEIIQRLGVGKRLVPVVFIAGEEYIPYVYTSSAWCTCCPNIHNGTNFESY